MKSKKHFPAQLWMRFLVQIVMWSFTKFFGIRAKMPKTIKDLDAPYLVLGNHIGFWDPFITGFFLPHFTRYVSSDAAFRNPLFSFFLTRLGTIPKKKNMRDSQVIRDIVGVIKQGNNVGIFPEGVRNWAGNTLILDISIIKLIKLLKVPVVVPILKGMNLFNPRWSSKLRKTKVEVHYKLLFTKDDIANLSDEDLFKKLGDTLQYDEVDYQKEKMNIIHSERRAEFISHALYICPECHGIDTFESKANNILCGKCGYEIHINKFGFFEVLKGGKLFFDNIRDWYNWEERWLLSYVKNKLVDDNKDIIFKDFNSDIYYSNTKAQPKLLGKADIELYVDRIEIKYKDKEDIIIFNFRSLQTINPQVNEMLEIYLNTGESYRVIGNMKGVSALKWEVAMNAIWRIDGQKNKLSTYINSNWLIE